MKLKRLIGVAGATATAAALMVGGFQAQKAYAEGDDNGIDVTINIKKNLEGKAITEGEFTFELWNWSDMEKVTDVNGNSEVTNDANGEASFTVHVDHAGEFGYYVREKNAGAENMTYDEEHKHVVFNVKANNNAKPDGEAVTYTSDSFPRTVDNDGEMVVYCINPWNSDAISLDGQRTRYLINDGGNGLTDILQRNNDGEHQGDYIPTGEQAVDKFVKILYYGYSHDKSGIGASYSETQNAIDWVSMYGNGSAPSYAGNNYKGGKAKDLLDFDNLPMPAEGTYNLYLFRSDVTDNADTRLRYAQCLIGLEIVEPSEDDDRPSFVLDGDSPKVEFNNTYTGETQPSSSSETQPSSSSETQPSSSSETQPSSSTRRNGSLKTTVSVNGNKSTASKSVEVEAGKYDVVDTIDYTDLTPNATYEVKGQLVCVDDEQVVGKASEERTASDSGSGSWEITFKNVTLEEGKKYVVYEYAVNPNGEGLDRAIHEDKTDKAQTVVVKKEVPTTSTDDQPTTSTDDQPTTSTDDQPTTSTDDQPTTSTDDQPTTSTDEQPTTEKTKGELATTVKVGDQPQHTGTADMGAELTFDETKALTVIEDTISYTNLVAGATYTVTGRVVEVNEYGKVINENVATNTLELVAEAADGEWTMTFDVSNVTLNSYSKYVVFESAYTKNGEDENATEDNPITHENVKDMAQSIYTENEQGQIRPDVEEGEEPPVEKDDELEKIDEQGKRKSNSTSQGSGKKGTGGPSTGDSSNAALYATAAAAAAGIAITAIALGKKKGAKK